MTAILGISAFYHDAAAALVVDGRIVAAAQEERFSRRKHDASFPSRAIEYCLAAARLDPAEVDYVAYYEKPLLKFDRLLETFLAAAPRGYSVFRRAVPDWLRRKLHVGRIVRRELRHPRRPRTIYCLHHQSHAASAFFPSPFDEAAILTTDGVGEWSTTCLGSGRADRIELTHKLTFPHSLGLLYSAFTAYLGFHVNDSEYKVMGLAPYGQPVYKDLILGKLLRLQPDGSFRLNMRYFGYCHGLTMTSPAFHRLLGGPPRRGEAPITRRHMDVAASVQAATEEVLLRIATHLHRQTGLANLVLAGGVALNCVANGRLLREGPFDDIWIQPAAGDAGGALGAALFTWHQLLGHERHGTGSDRQQGSLLGPAFSDDDVQAALDEAGAEYTACPSDEELCRRVARLLVEGNTVGWFQGRMELGPRALGSRSILADARPAEMQSRLNRQIKFRESFRPFAPIVPLERTGEYFDFPPGRESPYMLLVAQVRGADPNGPNDPADVADPGARPRGQIPAVTHVDGSARLQTVDRSRQPLLHRLLGCFDELTGCPVLVNTSFNVRDEPIVCTPADAHGCFMRSGLDALAIGKFLLLKRDQPPQPGAQRAAPRGERREALASVTS